MAFSQVTLLQQTLAANDADVEEEGVGPQNAAGGAGVSCPFVVSYELIVGPILNHHICTSYRSMNTFFCSITLCCRVGAQFSLYLR